MQERNMYDVMDTNNQSHHLRSFVIGAAVGAGIALLLAPTNGSDARRKLGGAAKRIKEKAGERWHEMRHDAEDAVEAGRESYRQTRDALNVGGTRQGSQPGSTGSRT
jgi:gas vesicle protein